MTPLWVRTDDNLRLAFVLRPRGWDWLEDDVRLIQRAGVNVLVSMLPPGEAAELGLRNEQPACEAAGMDFYNFPIPDREAPASTTQFRAFVEHLRAELHAGKSVAVHCRASIGRSSVLLAAILCSEGLTAEQAFHRLSEARGLEVPDTPEQVRWIENLVAAYADEWSVKRALRIG